MLVCEGTRERVENEGTRKRGQERGSEGEG